MWFKVDDKLHDHYKANRAGKAAMGVWVLAGSWAGDNLTDGFVPARVLGRWGTVADAKRLVEAGLWEPCQRDGEDGWMFHEFLDRNPSRAQVEAERAAAAERQKRAREAARAKRERERSADATPPSH